MKTLTEKDLKYYLGTGLNFLTCYNIEHEPVIEEMTLNYLQSFIEFPVNEKPLLLPLSALTEQLPDGSIPIVELANIADFGEFEKFKYKETSTAYIVCMSDDCVFMILKKNLDIAVSVHKKPCFAPNQLALFEYLYANHFWLGDQSLFETGEIIDKITVKT